MNIDDAPLEPLPPGAFRAAVRSADGTTEYLRAGSGLPVLVLCRRCGEGLSRPVIFEAVGRQFRLVAPEALPDAEQVPGWLCRFIDGLGLARFSVVADEEFAVAILSWALSEPDRIDRIVFLTKAPGEAPRTATLQDDRADIAHPILIVPRLGPPGEVLSLVGEFLAADEG